MNFGDIFVPALMVFILCYGLVKKVDIVNVFCEVRLKTSKSPWG